MYTAFFILVFCYTPFRYTHFLYHISILIFLISTFVYSFFQFQICLLIFILKYTVFFLKRPYFPSTFQIYQPYLYQNENIILRHVVFMYMAAE